MVLFLLFSLINIYIFWNGWSTSQYLDLSFKPCKVLPQPFSIMGINQFLHIEITDCSQSGEESLALYQSINRGGSRSRGALPPPRIEMTCGFLIQLYKICCLFDIYSRQFTLCFCLVNVFSPKGRVHTPPPFWDDMRLTYAIP